MSGRLRIAVQKSGRLAEKSLAMVEAAGFRVLLSNNVPVVSTDKYKVMAGYPGAITFAEQVNKLEAYRPEKRFADAMKGLLLYGSRVVRPNGIAVMTVQKA